MNTLPEQTKIYRQRWMTLTVVSLSVLIIVIDSTIVNVALPTLQRELNATGTQLQWIVNAYIMVFGALMLTTGTLGDRLGRKYILQAGILLFGAASIGASFAITGTHLIIWRIIMGIGGAMILPATLAIITNVFPREERGRAIGTWAGLNAIGIALGPIIGGLLVENYNWNIIFLINIPISLLALLGGIIYIPNSRDLNPRRIDVPGTMLSIIGLGGIVFGLIQGSNWGWTDAGVITALAGGTIFITAFLLWENHTDHPMLAINFFRKALFSTGIGAVSLMAFAQTGITFGLTLYMQFVNGYSALETGVRFIPLALGLFIGAGSSDRIVKALGLRNVLIIGFVASAAFLTLTAFWDVQTAYWIIGLATFGIGFSLGYIAAPATNAIMGALPDAQSGVGSAMASVCRMVAGSIGVAVMGSILGTVYASSFTNAAASVAGLSPQIIKSASDSVGTAIIISQQLPSDIAQTVASIARTSFMDGWKIMALASCAISVVAAVMIFRFMPARAGSVKETTEPENTDMQREHR